MKEIWKPISGYENLYEVSNLGRVRSCTRVTTQRIGVKYPVRGCVLKPIVNSRGYFVVGLYKDKNGRQFFVHRLVADAFIPKVEGKDFIDHIDTNKENNAVSNLRWVTYEENNNNELSYAARIKEVRRVSTKKVYRIDLLTGETVEYDSVISASIANNIHRSTIRRYANGQLKCKKYKWVLGESIRKERT